MQAQEVTDDDGQLGVSVIQHQAAGINVVVDVFRWKWMKPTHDRFTQRWRDTGRRRPGPKWAGGVVVAVIGCPHGGSE